MKLINSFNYRVWCFFVFATIGLLSCQKNENVLSQAGRLNLFLTDDPSLVFDNIFIDIRKVEIKLEDNSSGDDKHGNGSSIEDHNGGSGGWITLPTNPRIVDILQFRNGLDTLLSTSSLTNVNSLKKIRLTLGNSNRVVVNGISSSIRLKDDVIEIKLEDGMIALNANGSTNIWLDFDGGRSIRQHGAGFELDPQLKAFTKDKTGSIEGRVLPADAKATVVATNGTDSSTAKPGREGEFKITGLKQGVYKLSIHATANNYKDISIANVVVRTQEDTKAGTIILKR